SLLYSLRVGYNSSRVELTGAPKFFGFDHSSFGPFRSTYQMSKSFFSWVELSRGLSETKYNRFPSLDKKGSRSLYASEKDNSSGAVHSLFFFVIRAICEIS